MSLSVFPCDVLCVGAGREQVAGIKKAQHLGLTVLAVDSDPEAGGLEVADQGLVLDPMNTEKLIEVARRAKIRAIVPVPLGAVLESCGILNTTLGLQGIQQHAAQFSVDKLSMRRILTTIGLPQPTYREASNSEEALKVCDSVGFPLVVKPRRGSGSRSVLLLRDKTEAERELAYARSRSPLLVESVITGKEFGVDGVVIGQAQSGGAFQLLLLRDKLMTEPPHRFCHSTSGPALVSKHLFKMVSETISQACVALDYSDCLVHADIMINDHGEVGIIEVSSRPSGYGISQQLLPAILGIDPCIEMLKMLSGQRFDFSPKVSRYGFVRLLPASFGRFIRVDGLSDARRLQDVVNLECHLKFGDLIAKNTDGAAIVSRYAIIAGDSMREAEANWKRVASTVHIVTEVIS